MILAVIDCGTNTFNLLILEIKNAKVDKKLLSTRESVKLGQGSLNGGLIADAAIERAINAFSIFNQHINKYKVEKVLAYATSAIREASNGKDFILKVNQLFNIKVEVIDGLKEADFIFLGVKKAVNLGEQTSLIMDIGGGSVEFILSKNKEIIWKKSFKIGAARILEMYQPSNPIKEQEIISINHFFKAELFELFEAMKEHKASELIGSSGAFESFIDLLADKNLANAIEETITEYSINLQHYFAMAEEIIKSTNEERTHLKALVPMRIDMIVISCLMVNFILKEFNLKHMRISTYSLKEGALMNFLENNKN
jgi:exopolyphosphatase/guanosine-5'-triphosphate,3'-diphosphate pyrophosphatase